MKGALLLTMAILSASTGAVPVEQEPLHVTIFRNDYLQVFRVRVEPGKKTGMHIHAHDDVAVRLSAATTFSEVPGTGDGPVEHAVPGMVSARSIEPKVLTHAVHNVGSTLFDVVDVQILKRPAGPAAPEIVLPAAQNDQMRVYRYELAPGESTPMHTHARPYLVVAATGDGPQDDGP